MKKGDIMSEIIHLTEESFEEKTGTGNWAIDFYADWCGPCKMMAPTFEEAAGLYEGKINFAKVDIEAQRKLAVANGVMSIPTLLFYKNGTQVDRVVGMVDKTVLAQKLEILL